MAYQDDDAPFEIEVGAVIVPWSAGVCRCRLSGVGSLGWVWVPVSCAEVEGRFCSSRGCSFGGLLYGFRFTILCVRVFVVRQKTMRKT